MACEICDEMRTSGSSPMTETGRFVFFLETTDASNGNPVIVVRDKYGEVGGEDGIFLFVENCPFCGESLT